MTKRRLVAFGCSYTHGHKLSDCPYPYSEPSKLAWPKKLAKLLGRKGVNMGFAGASNKEILYAIQCCDFLHDDIVVILWTYAHRDCVILDDKIKNTSFGVWTRPRTLQGLPETSKPKDKWYHLKRALSDYDGYHQMWTSMNYAKYHLDSLGVKNYHFTIKMRYVENPPKWNNVNVIDMCFSTVVDPFPRATDDKHPGQIAHEVLARTMKVKINAHNQ